MKTIGYLTTTIALLIYAALMNGWALSKLWAWFIVPALSAPPLQIPAAIGICYIVAFLKPLSTTKNEKPWSDLLLTGLVVSTLNPLVILGCAGIVRLWM